jgi:hypothetical protein
MALHIFRATSHNRSKERRMAHTDSLGTFPFGEPVRKLTQTDRTQKDVFVLGVYASAVHARWVSPAGRTVVRALAVASEPCIFWRGEDAEQIVRKIEIRSEAGTLSPADPQLNGPSGNALDEQILKPLGLSRSDVWLCDLVPYSCINGSQEAAVHKHYIPLVEQLGLPPVTTPKLPNRLTDTTRRQEILEELLESGARTLILLGDKPIQWFLRHYDQRFHSLAEFGTDSCTYGKRHSVTLGGRTLDVLPLAHPRQIAKLGRSSQRWYDLHEEWVGRQ